MKWVVYVVLALLVALSWTFFSRKGSEVSGLESQIAALYEQGDPEGQVPELQQQLQNVQGDYTMHAVLLALLGAGLLGTVFVVHVLPAIVQRATHAVYDSSEMVEQDPMHDARSLMAQGAYAEAIEACRAAAALQPGNRLPWVEMVKIYKDHLHQPEAAIQTLREALEQHEWQVNDAAYLLFRLAELYNECLGDRDAAAAIMQQVVDQFPGTRHSANARHQLSEWHVDGGAAQREAEERAFLERMRSQQGPT